MPAVHHHEQQPDDLSNHNPARTWGCLLLKPGSQFSGGSYYPSHIPIICIYVIVYRYIYIYTYIYIICIYHISISQLHPPFFLCKSVQNTACRSSCISLGSRPTDPWRPWRRWRGPGSSKRSPGPVGNQIWHSEWEIPYKFIQIPCK